MKYIASYTNPYDETFYGRGDTPEEALQDLQSIDDTVISASQCDWYKAEKLTLKYTKIEFE